MVERKPFSSRMHFMYPDVEIEGAPWALETILHSVIDEILTFCRNSASNAAQNSWVHGKSQARRLAQVWVVEPGSVQTMPLA